MHYKYNTNFLYNSSYIYYIDCKFNKNIFLNFKKNNKLIRKLYILLISNFYVKTNNNVFFKISLPDFLNYDYKFLNLLGNKSFFFFYFSIN